MECRVGEWDRCTKGNVENPVMSESKPSLKNLNDAEREVVRQCLRAAVESPLFSDWEFGTLFGLEREDVRSVLLSWQELDESDPAVTLAINNSLNNLLYYPDRTKPKIWTGFISVTPCEVAHILDKWQGRAARDSNSARSFVDNLM